MTSKPPPFFEWIIEREKDNHSLYDGNELLSYFFDYIDLYIYVFNGDDIWRTADYNSIRDWVRVVNKKEWLNNK